MKHYLKLFKGNEEIKIELTMNLECLLKMIRMGAIFFTNPHGNFEYYSLSNFDKMIIEDDLGKGIYENLMYGENVLQGSGNNA